MAYQPNPNLPGYTPNPAATSSMGVGGVPMTVEPLHNWEKEALTTVANPPMFGGGSMVMANEMLQKMMSNPAAFTSQYVNPMATDYMTRAGDATEGAMRQIGFDEVQGMANPYASSLKNRLNEAGAAARAAIAARQGMRGGRSFGDTSTGIRQGMIDQELLSKGSDIDYNTWNDSYARLQDERGRMMQGGAQFGNLASGAQGITNSAAQAGLAGINALFGAGRELTDVGWGNVNNKMRAGQYVRNYNQNINDMIGSDILASQQWEPAQIERLQNMLKGFESGNTYAPKANSLQQIGGIAGGIGEVMGGGNKLWQDINFALRPSGTYGPF